MVQAEKIFTADDEIILYRQLFVDRISINNNYVRYPPFRKIAMNTNMLPAPQKKLGHLCLGMEAMLLLSLVTLPVVCGYWLFRPVQLFTDDGQLLDGTLFGALSAREILQSVLDTLVISLVLLQMFFFFGGVRRGELFTLQCVRRARHTGLTFVSGYILNQAVRAFTDSPLGEGLSYDTLTLVSMELDSLLQLLMGAGLLALSCILEKAKVLNDEQELVI